MESRAKGFLRQKTLKGVLPGQIRKCSAKVSCLGTLWQSPFKRLVSLYVCAGGGRAEPPFPLSDGSGQRWRVLTETIQSLGLDC